MIFDARKFLEDHQLDYSTGGKNVGKGWIGIKCPMINCDDESTHGGFSPRTGGYTCWKCGTHSLENIILALLPWLTYSQAENIIKQYQTISISPKEKQKKLRRKRVLMPINCGPLSEKHKRYLEKRNFDPDYLQDNYYLLGTGPLGNYKHRIIVPIFLNKRMVSYHSRDVTGKQIKHKACPKEDELVGHKHTLYNLDSLIGPNGAILEGLADTWRMGPKNAVGTFGISFTPQQVNRLIKRPNIKRYFVLYDTAEEEALIQANKLAWQLNACGKETHIIEFNEGDPAELSNEEAKILRKELGL